MIKHFVRHTFTLILLAAFVAGFNSCKDDISLIADDGSIPDMTGEQVTFNTALSSAVESLSRSYIYDDNYQGSYKPINDAYKLKITMWQKQGDTETQLRTCTYVPDGTTDGFLKASPAAGESALYWDSSTTPYAFSVAAGTDTPEADQSDRAKWLAQDSLIGYGFEPLVVEGLPLDNLNVKNYHTAKEWYKYNQIWMSGEQGMVPKTDLKRIPLFLSHTRSWITVILKAGEGVDRSVLDYDNGNAASRISTEIFSYTPDSETSVTPWMQACDVEYEKDVNGKAETRRGVRYDAIVTPKSYLETDKRICKINVSSQNFSFYPSNDPKYETYMHDGMSNSDVWAYMDEAYNPKAGVHVTYTVTLSRESRKILITAYVEDWTELVTQSICDDFGMNGDPIPIQNRQQLIDFLKDESQNKPGNVAIVSAAAIDLDKKKDGESLTDDPWSNYNRYDLKCTLNLGGSVLSTSSQFVNDIAASGSIINGSIHMKSSTSSVKTAVCGTNEGSIEYLSVTADASARASVAGIAQTNYGTITKCRSNLTVRGDGTTNFVGGIASVSIYKDSEQAIMPVIDNCEVTARVGIPNDINTCYGGGIVGQAAGRVSNCTYEYGVSLLESSRTDSSNHQFLLNIANQVQQGRDLSAYGNQWPTADTNNIGNHASNNANLRTGLYNAVIDCQDELELLVKEGSSYNAKENRYRIADSFSVSSDAGWPLKSSNYTTDNSTHGNVLFFLEGNGKTITLTGEKAIEHYGATSSSTSTVKSAPMLFNNIMGTVQNLNIYCEKPLYGEPQFNSEGKNVYTDGCGTLAYAVFGGTVSNVTVYGANDAFVQASSAGGIVVSLHDGSKLENCNCFIPVKMFLPYDNVSDISGDKRFYSGGIAAFSENGKVSITECRYINTVTKQETNTTARRFLGGIVGGLRRTEVTDVNSPISHDNPSLTITDCASWFYVNVTPSGSTGGQTSGSLIGRALFTKQEGTNTQDYNGMSGCQGNWWFGNVGAGSWKTATEAAAIGKKNAVEPSKPDAPTN